MSKKYFLQVTPWRGGIHQPVEIRPTDEASRVDETREGVGVMTELPKYYEGSMYCVSHVDARLAADQATIAQLVDALVSARPYLRGYSESGGTDNYQRDDLSICSAVSKIIQKVESALAANGKQS